MINKPRYGAAHKHIGGTSTSGGIAARIKHAAQNIGTFVINTINAGIQR